jgi:Cdc6-like AAA superfamily ATPase
MNLWDDPTQFALFYQLCGAVASPSVPLLPSDLSSPELEIQERSLASKKVIEEILNRKVLQDVPLAFNKLRALNNTLDFVLTETTQRNVGLMQQVLFEGGKRFLCLEGETGVGKTATVMYIAEIARCKTTRPNCSAATSSQQLFGRTVSKSDDHNSSVSNSSSGRCSMRG